MVFTRDSTLTLRRHLCLLFYKTAANVPDDIRKQLKDCAERVYGLDVEMEQIYQEIESVDS